MPGIKKLEIKAGLIVCKPANEVFEAIADPSKMSRYFISESTGRMEAGKTLTWKFPEMDMEFPVRIIATRKDEYISYNWDDMDGTETAVEIFLKPAGAGKTFVTVTEKSRENNEAGIQWLRQNTEGWANFLACLKAYLEYGINLRKEAFDISQLPITENQPPS